MLVRHLDMPPEFTVEAEDLEDLLAKVDKGKPGFRDSICDEAGMVRVYVNVFLNEERIAHDAQALKVRFSEGDDVYILASVAGGSGSA
jgi:molybdopterin synthase sulfur carrier subunit